MTCDVDNQCRGPQPPSRATRACRADGTMPTIRHLCCDSSISVPARPVFVEHQPGNLAGRPPRVAPGAKVIQLGVDHLPLRLDDLQVAQLAGLEIERAGLNVEFLGSGAQ